MHGSVDFTRVIAVVNIRTGILRSSGSCLIWRSTRPCVGWHAMSVAVKRKASPVRWGPDPAEGNRAPPGHCRIARCCGGPPASDLLNQPRMASIVLKRSG
jgi:hypothetical protein